LIQPGTLKNFTGSIDVSVKRSKNLLTTEGTSAGGNILLDYSSEEKSVSLSKFSIF